MPTQRVALVPLFTTLVACSAAPAPGTTSQDPQPAAAQLAPDPLAGFARMFPGEWRMTAASGTSMFRTWQRGPSRHSLRMVTDGQSAGGEPWRELDVVYWHPGRQRVCLLGFSCYARGVAEAELSFGEHSVQFDTELHQVRARRTLRSVWTFQGPDTYHATLLEKSSGLATDYELLAEWDWHRRQAPVPARSVAVDGADEPSLLLAPLRPLLGRWESQVDAAHTNAQPMQSTFEWMPLADVIHARVLGVGQAGGMPLLDLFLYHHTGRGTLRCLAVSNRGSIHEGDVQVLDGGSVQIELQGHDGAQELAHTVRLDLATAAALHCRIWGSEGTERRLQLDRRFTQRAGS